MDCIFGWTTVGHTHLWVLFYLFIYLLQLFQIHADIQHSTITTVLGHQNRDTTTV